MTDSSPEPAPELPPKAEPTLEYNNSLGQPPEQLKGAKVAMFIAGLLSGLAASGVAYVAAGAAGGPAALVVAILLVLGAKIALAVHLFRVHRRWASFAKGVLTSIGLLILLAGACFGLLATMKF
jgi:hypothetical protein